MLFLRFLILFWRSPTTGLLASKVKKTLSFSHIIHCSITSFRKGYEMVCSKSLNPSFPLVRCLLNNMNSTNKLSQASTVFEGGSK